MPIYKADGKKDGLQKYNVRVNYVSNDGKAKQLTRTAYGSEAAKDLERRLNNEIKEKGENSVKKMSVQQLFDEYITVKKYELRESTIQRSSTNYRTHIQPTMAHIQINKLNVAMLQEWKLTIEEKGLALETRKKAYNVFRALLNYAVRMEYIDKNPIGKIGNFKDVSEFGKKNEVGFYTAQEFTRFISTAKRLAEERQAKNRDLFEWDFYVFFNIAFYTGLRKGEIHALKWSDIDGTYLSVQRSITQKLKGEDRETAPKNKSSVRTLQMPLPLIQVLNEHRERQEKQERFTEEYRICGGERCLRDTTIQNRNMHYAALSGLHVIKIHSFRHSHVSVLANANINIMEVARRLGHARVEETWNTYSHLYPHEEERAVDVLNNIA